MTQPTEYQAVTDGAPDGANVGKSSTEKVGFWGATPVARQSITAVATTTATTALNETKINRLYAALRTIGLIATDG